MVKVNSVKQVAQIVEGHYKELTKQENDLFEHRMGICKKCPLYTEKPGLGPVCDGKKCWNIKTNTLELLPGDNVKCGCGCRLSAAVRVKNKKCVLNKW